jgi:hypothetical protein
MGVQRKRRRRVERLEEEEAERGREPAQERVEEKEQPKEREATPAGRVLDLQKTAGNRATNAALARWGLPWFPATVAPQWPKEPQVIADGTVLPMSSFSWSDPHGGTGASPGKQRPDGEVVVTTTVGEHSAGLAQRTAEGDPFKTVIIVMPHSNGTGVTITLTEVYVTGYQISGQTESWTLHFEKREFSQAPPPAQP